jgi:hypothetical protein
MNPFDFLRSRRWALVRRLILVGAVVFLALRNYGSNLSSWLQRPNGERDIILTQYEFRPELPGAKPGWIMEFRNDSDRFTYDQIELEATYLDAAGAVLQKDQLLVNQRLEPGGKQLVGSVDFRDRPGATRGTLKVSKAESVK